MALCTDWDVSDAERRRLELQASDRPRLFEVTGYVPVAATVWPRSPRDAVLAATPVGYSGALSNLWGFEDGAAVFRRLEYTETGPVFHELGRLDKDDDGVLRRHRSLLPSIVGVRPSLVAHHDVERSAHTGIQRDRHNALYVGDEASALSFFPRRPRSAMELRGLLSAVIGHVTPLGQGFPTLRLESVR